MLVLSRRIGETIYIDTTQGRITVRLGGIRGNIAQLAFDAPKAVVISRAEIEKAPKVAPTARR